jgi:hypothetical protein
MLGIARRAIPVISVKTSESSRSATTTLASASCSSVKFCTAGPFYERELLFEASHARSAIRCCHPSDSDLDRMVGARLGESLLLTRVAAARVRALRAAHDAVDSHEQMVMIFSCNDWNRVIISAQDPADWSACLECIPG